MEIRQPKFEELTNHTGTKDSLEQEYHRNMPIEQFLDYIESGSKKNGESEYSTFKKEDRTYQTNFSNSAYHEMKQQLVPLPYTVITSNNELNGLKNNASSKKSELSDSSSSAIEFSIKMQTDNSQMTSKLNSRPISTQDRAITPDRDGLKDMKNLPPSEQLKTFKTFELSPYTQQTNQNIPSARTQTEFKLTDRTKAPSIPFQISQTSTSSQNSENPDPNLNEFYCDVSDPFTSPHQLYHHSNHAKSIESNSSDDYDNEGTSRKRTKRNEEESLDGGYVGKNTDGQLFKNMFNEECNSDLFSLKRSLPNQKTKTLLEQYMDEDERSTRITPSDPNDLEKHILKPNRGVNFMKHHHLKISNSKDSRIKYSSEKCQQNVTLNSEDKENSRFLSKQLNYQIKRTSEVSKQQFDYLMDNENVKLTTIKKREHCSVTSSLRFGSGNENIMFQNFGSGTGKNNSLNTIPLTLIATSSDQNAPESDDPVKSGREQNDKILSQMSKEQKKEIFMKLTSDNELLNKQIVSFQINLIHLE